MSEQSTFDQFFPLRRLGLTKNPFGTLTPEEIVEVTVLPPVIYDVINEGFDHLQVIGDRGRGKSTTLRWFYAYLRSQGRSVAYERIPRWQFNYHTDIQDLDCFLLDEAQRLFVLNQNQLFRQAEGKRLIIGTHISWNRAFRRQGWHVTTIHIGDHTSRDHIQRIIERRLQFFATDGGLHICFDDSAVEYLWQRWCDNLRGMEFFLYHVIQHRNKLGIITADELATVFKNYVEPDGLA